MQFLVPYSQICSISLPSLVSPPSHFTSPSYLPFLPLLLPALQSFASLTITVTPRWLTGPPSTCCDVSVEFQGPPLSPLPSLYDRPWPEALAVMNLATWVSPALYKSQMWPIWLTLVPQPPPPHHHIRVRKCGWSVSQLERGGLREFCGICSNYYNVC